MKRRTKNTKRLRSIRVLAERAATARLTGKIQKALHVERLLEARIAKAERSGLDYSSAEERGHHKAHRRLRA